jgi:hypothetical protein
MKPKNKTLIARTDYIRNAGETVETVILNGKRVIYIHFENGYYSLLEGVDNLHAFLCGDISVRFACTESMEETDKILQQI